MLLHNSSSDWQFRLHNARRVFSLVPLFIFLVSLMVFSSTSGQSYLQFIHVVLQSIALALASSFVSVGAYGFYKYLVERSPGL